MGTYLRRLLSPFRSKYTEWSAFTKLTQDEALSLFKELSKENDWDYESTESAGKYLYSNETSVTMSIVTGDGKVDVNVAKATGDPFLRMIMGVTGNELPEISRIRLASDTEKLVTLLASEFANSVGEPWDVKDHPRFRTSPGLYWYNKRKWSNVVHRQ